MRELLPDRRRSWTQKVRIAGQTFFLSVGEYDDGRPGEIFVVVSKQGTFLRGVMDALARTASLLLQNGGGLEAVVQALRGTHYPPEGAVENSPAVSSCSSVTDWIAAELEGKYLAPSRPPGEGEGDAK